MVINLVELTKGSIPPGVVSRLAGFLGAGPANTQTAINIGLPVILGGLVEKSSTEQGASDILKIIAEGGADESSLKNLENDLNDEGKTKNFISSGTGILDSLFGDNLKIISSFISRTCDLSSDSVSSILGFLAPVIAGIVRKQVSAGNLNSDGLAKLFSGQKNFLAGLIPANLSGLISNVIQGKVAPDVPVSDKTNEGNDQTANVISGFKMKKYMPWVLIGVVLIIAVILWKGSGNDNVTPEKKVETDKVETKKVEPKKDDSTKKGTHSIDVPKSGDAEMDSVVASLGKFMKRKLPGGKEIVFAKSGVELDLISFIVKNKPLEKATWFSFDRILFEPGKATLKPSSLDQLKNISEIMRAYPNIEIMIGGFTDSTENEADNLKLSKEKANSVMAELVSLGVAQNRMKAEGYGSKNPVASNKTPRGRARNRRIDLKVIKK